MNVWLQISPLLIVVFWLALLFMGAWEKRRAERQRVFQPHWGEEIPGRADKTPIEES